MTVKLLIPGQREVASASATRGGPPGAPRAAVTDLLDPVQVVDAFSLSAPSRARAAIAEPRPVDAELDDVLEIEVEGFTLWTSVERYRQDVALFNPGAIRDGVIVVDAMPRPSASDRGIREWAAGAVRILRLGKDRLADEIQDPTILQEFAHDCGLEVVGKAGGWLLAKLLIWVIERQLRPREGLYAWEAATREPQAGQPDPAPASFDGVDVSKPMLVFVHGTASSTRGSFGQFLTKEAEAEWRVLTGFFGHQIYAFEHRTLSRSPIENAIVLAEQLPAGANLHLVSHSRGGIVADLLCLSSLSPDRIAQFTRRDDDMKEADAHDREGLTRLASLLAAKKLQVQRFARCACPARGTLLASENLDQFLSVLTNLVGFVPMLAASPAYDVIKRITLETAKNRWQPAVIAGLEAQTPGSPLVRLLNDTEAAGALGVVAGDIQGGNWLKRLGVFITDRFLYDNRDNDLVVNTDSMFQGAHRQNARYIYDQGTDVSHFNYFRNGRTRDAVARWVTAGAGEVAPFLKLTEALAAPVPMARGITARGGVTQPVVFVIPGLMGSGLLAGDEEVWLDFQRISDGALGRLEDIDDRQVRPATLLGESFEDLCLRLDKTHQVVPFAYDWRKSITSAASELAARIEAQLGGTKQAVRILAHGTGGLVFRQFASTYDKLWDRVCERDGARVVLLGTPHHGSFESVQILLGTHPVIQQLALLDRMRGLREVVELFQGFPGVLEMLPPGGGQKFFTAETWRMLRGDRMRASNPSAGQLAAARRVVDGLGEQIPHADRILSIAGSASGTVAGVDVRDGRLVLEVTTEGDGRVTYKSSRLPGVLTWFMDAGHGDLPASEPGFPALLDLLENGSTSRLPTAPPSVSRGGASTFETTPELVLYPTRGDLAAAVAGRRRRRAHKGTEPLGFGVSVVHGDLRFARYPIVVGHYEGDTIVGAEAQIDRMLGGALMTRYNLALYPGRSGTVAVVLRPPTPLQRALQLSSGAIVLGLGRWGELTAAQIANFVRQGALHYVLQLDDSACDPAADAASTPPGGPGLSVLLIGGTSAANISIDDSVGAILRGVAQANQELDKRVRAVTTRISQVEIVELYADTAIQASRAAQRLARALSEELGLEIRATTLLERGRYGRVRHTAPGTLDAWRRWEVSVMPADTPAPPTLPAPIRDRLKACLGQEGADAPLLGALVDMAFPDRSPAAAHRELRFVSLSDRARAEVMLQQRQPELIERLIRSSISNTTFYPEHARALFELMVPNDLKDNLSQLSRVVLVVDGESSQYPWELMSDGTGQPLCTRIGMVRQLQTGHYRAQIRATTASTALIVGDPLVTAPFPQLEGAHREATMVADLLESQKEPGGEKTYDVTVLNKRDTSLAILGSLLTRPYRLVHLAGHGYYEAPTVAGGRARSGMVLDNGVFLTAVEIGQMVQVPELVFLNCCFIGQIGAEAPAAPRDVEFNRLAASVSRELIEMGVRAVVAAGWAVRDDAAALFARAFYEQLLQGAPFGRALQEARNRTFAQFPDTNTWGAYQAYGDPDFRLVHGEDGQAIVTYVAPEELIDRLTTLRRSVPEVNRDAKDPKTALETMAQQLGALVKKTPPEWMGRSDVLMALGYAYGEVSSLVSAAGYLQAALDTGELEHETTVKAIEQLANFEVREACARAKKAKGAARVQALADVQRAIDRLDALQRIAKTAERFSLLGSAYKRLASVFALSAEPAAREANLAKSADCYKAAHEHNARRGVVDSYPLINWLALEAVLQTPVPDIDVLLVQAEAAAKARFARTRDPFDAVFDAVAFPDVAVIRALLQGTFNQPASRQSEISRIVALYKDAFSRTSVSERQMSSATDQLSTLKDLLRVGEGMVDGQVLARDALMEIRQSLVASSEPQTDSEPVAPAEPSATAAVRKARSTARRKPAKPSPRRKKGRH